ncbi:hypothetical protein [Lelliottia nimipressuralis]|uniref:Uncharacterized protein n=1 Tax=Lelliottia nimipressuralis TaxID=69220 RepID=A0ABY3P6B2_9ENTR|nr:hypothetical protein [Lelliottia nimipressuralis]RXJ10443.1 hypothetical protein ETG88_19965 [Lelliottia nimipressuralis]TYT34988.1 hypothetical protein FZO59_04985 [Lelliottia nimipressuralis]
MNGMDKSLSYGLPATIIITGSLYTCSYLHQLGYSVYFGYPYIFIEVDFKPLIFALIFFAFYIYFFWAYKSDKPLKDKSKLDLISFIITTLTASVLFTGTMLSQVKGIGNWGVLFVMTCCLSATVLGPFLYRTVIILKLRENSLGVKLLLLGNFIILSVCSGWVLAAYSPIIYSTSKGQYLLRKDGEFGLFGQCIDGKRVFEYRNLDGVRLSTSKLPEVRAIKHCLNK